MPKTYELKTIIDIYEKVPTNKIAVCMAELSESLIMAKSIRESVELVGSVVETKLPDVFVWVDDGKGEVKVNCHLIDSDGECGVVSAKRIVGQ